MASPDPRGNPCGTRNAAARDAAEPAPEQGGAQYVDVTPAPWP